MAKKREQEAQAQQPDPEARVQVPVRLKNKDLERLRDCIFWIGRGLSIQSLLEQAALDTIERLEKEHNHGRPFQPRTGEIPKGRR